MAVPFDAGIVRDLAAALPLPFLPITLHEVSRGGGGGRAGNPGGPGGVPLPQELLLSPGFGEVRIVLSLWTLATHWAVG